MKQLHHLKLTLLLLAVAVSSGVKAQYPDAASYPFEASTKTFTYLSGGTSVNLQSDDRTVTGIPIGFTFEYCNATYTTMSACSNGFMAFGNNTNTSFTNSLGNMNNFNPGLMPLWDDLQGSGSVTTYKTTGTAGSRVFTFEWRNTRPLNNTANPVISMQVKLYEGANAIEFIYKREHPSTNFPSATVGIAGRVNGDYKVLDNASANPTPTSATFVNNITTKPATDQSYLWGDLPKGHNNASVSDLASPSGIFCANSTIPVSVVIKNKGKNNINKVTVGWTLDGTAQTDVNVNTTIYPIGGGTPNSTVVNLGNIPFGTAGREFVVYTSMPNGIADTVNVDDTLKFTLKAGLNGVYTVGTGGDYVDVKEAVDDLNKYGVCGAVTMDIMPGIYTDQVELKTVTGASAANRITFKSQSNTASSAIVAFAPSGSDHVFKLTNSSYVTLKDITIQSTASNAGRVLVFDGNSSHDSVLNCIVEASATATSSNTSGIYGTELSGSDNVFIGNSINRGYYGIYWRGISSSNLTDDNVFEENTISENYVYATYFYENNNLKVRNNTISSLNSPTTFYGSYAYYNDNNFEFTGNTITIEGTGGTTYGIRMYYNDGTSSNMGIIGNNTIAINKTGSSTSYGIYAYYSRYQNFINNSVSVTSASSSSQAARFYYSNSNSYRYNTIRNNVFATTGPGLGMYCYYVGRNCTWDYNNIYTSNGTNLVQRGSPSGTYKDINAWRKASDQDLNSISYNPGFMSATNLRPDPTNPASWSLNGRALHIATNNKDKDGNTRVELREDGVPDLGAYEFEPSVKPPLADATPASVQPGDKQVFTFGGNVVATVEWNPELKITSPLEIRQYSGRKAPGFTYNDFMYFYTGFDHTAPSSTYNFDIEVNYMDIWLGNISPESDLRLAHQYKNYGWVGYNGTASSVDANKNLLTSDTKTSFGMFTGTLNGEIFSAHITPASSTIICHGHDVLLTANSGAQFTYQWKLNGVEIQGATSQTYLASQAGDYTVKITTPSNVAESMPVTVATIAPPNANVTASSNLTYCTGGSLSLMTQQGQGLTYQWKLNGNNIPGATSANYNVQQAGKYTVMVTNEGCGTESLVQDVQAGPLNVDLGADIFVCENKGLPIIVDAGYPGAKYQWSTGETTQKITITKNGTYTVQVDAGPNCLDVDDIKVEITPLPTSNGISYVNNGNTYSFTPSNPQNTTGYLWIFGDGTTSNQQNVTKTFNGNVYVRMVLFNQCGTDTTQLGGPLSVGNVSTDNGIALYPNPANDVISITLGGDIDVQGLIILNSVGATVSRPTVTAGKQNYSVNVSSLPTGSYILQIRAADGVVNKKFNIVR